MIEDILWKKNIASENVDDNNKLRLWIKTFEGGRKNVTFMV